jgi:hypothetical protein
LRKVKGDLFQIHWNEQEAKQFMLELRASGWNVDWEARDGGKVYRAILADPPQVVVIY